MTLYLLTAPSGAGKTTFCRALAEEARAAGWDVAGVLSPPLFENGIKTGIRVQNLRTDETRLLAHLFPSPLGRGVRGEGTPLGRGARGEGIPLGNWLFDPSALAWGNDLLASCLPADLFIVDELGPLELLRGGGWQNALEALRQNAYKIGIAVIRPSLLEVAQTIYPAAQILSLPQEAHRFFLSLQGV